jgi:hypothetical protein
MRRRLDVGGSALARLQRSCIAGRRRRNRIAGEFTALLTETLESPAWGVLSLSGRRILDRVAIELRSHGGYVGEGLCVTYDDFEAYGIDRQAIGPAIREVVALGFLRIKQAGYGGNSEFRRPTLYEPTYLNMIDSEPTHDWRRIQTVEEAQMRARAARKSGPQKQKTSGGKPTVASGGKPTENPNFPMGETPTPMVGETPTTSESLEEPLRRRLHPGAPARSVRAGSG